MGAARWFLAATVLGFGLACAGETTGDGGTPAPDPEPAPAPTPAPPVPVRQQLQPVDTRIGTLERTAWLHLPDGNDGQKMPLIVMLHGEDSDARKFANVASPFMDRGVAFLFPSGKPGHPPTEPAEGKAGKRKRGDDPEPRNDIELGESWQDEGDRAWIEVVVDQVVRAHPIDPEQVYVAGLGEGGRLVLELACATSSSKTFQGYAPVGAALSREAAKTCEAPGFPAPMLVIAGTDDEVTLWTGDKDHLSISETAELFAKKNDCDLSSRKEDLLEDTDGSDETRVKRHSWSCEGASVELLEVSGGGHTWPHPSLRAAPKTSRDIDALAEITDLFAIELEEAAAPNVPLPPSPREGKGKRGKRR
ncbi:MAG: hypothetical protein H6735_00820 [Alphaproteobacteria bacterium]|nr:hypothetical protein [Alphaproteobacteria bacterium]